MLPALLPQKSPPQRVILLHLLAPPKPAWGAACNGCGVCCTAQPCPLGMLLSHKRQGRCAALIWDDAACRYHCGPLAQPQRWLNWLPPRWAKAVVTRWIAAGQGCDSDLTVG